MAHRHEFAPEDRETDVEEYDVAPEEMPPTPAGADGESGGEAAASRRLAGLPPRLARSPLHQSGEPTPDAEPILGYDGFDTDGVIEWIRDADPDLQTLRNILEYEAEHQEREPIVRELTERIDRFEEPPPS